MYSVHYWAVYWVENKIFFKLHLYKKIKTTKFPNFYKQKFSTVFLKGAGRMDGFGNTHNDF